MEKLWGDFSQLCGIMCAVCFIVFLKSCVSCPSRRWPRPCNRIPPWRSWFWRITTSALKGPRLGVRWGWGYEGKAQWRNTERTDQDIADWKWHSGNDKRQCNAELVSRCIHPVEICDDKGLVYFDVFGMYWPDPGRKEKHFITVLFPKQVTLSFSNLRSSNQVWNGIRHIWMFWKLKWFTLLVTLPIVQEDHSGGRLDWSNMTSDRGYWSDPAPNHQKTYFHIKI